MCRPTARHWPSGAPRLTAPMAAALTGAALLATSACAVPDGSPGAPGAARSADLLVLGGTLITMDASRTVLADGGVAIEEGAIVAVGPADELRREWRGREVVELGAYDLVLPGLVNGHGHAPMALLRGLADDLALMDWLQGYIFPAEAQTVDEAFVRAGTELAALEMIRTGTTTFTDMYYFEDAIAEVTDRAGLRAILGQTVIGFPAPDYESPATTLAHTEAFLDRWREHPRITPAVAPHAPYTLEAEDLTASADLARRNGVPILVHLSETRDEVRQVRDRSGLTPTAYLDRLGVLGPDVVGFHAVWLTDDDIALLADRNVGLVHNPESNLKLASGAMSVQAVRAAGIAVGLGTDGPASNNDLDLFDALSLAALLQKHERDDPTALPAPEVLAMATIEGARALGLADRIGSLEPGKRADLIVLDGDRPNLVPRYDPYSHVVYAASGNDVRLTMVDGRILYRDGRFATLDLEAVRTRARRLADRVREAVDGGGSPGARQRGSNR